MASRAKCCGSELTGWDHDGSPQASPPQAEAGAGAGGRDPTPVSKRGGCSATAGLATCPRRKPVSLLGGTQADAFLADLDVADSARRQISVAASWSAERPRSSGRRLGSWALATLSGSCSNMEALWTDRFVIAARFWSS
jgi:hypothetical protein